MALGWLSLSALLGASILSRGALGVPGVARLIAAHAELMLVGWMMQLAFGVAWWILPGRERRDPGTITRPLALVSLGLNAGILLVTLGAPLSGRLCECIAAVTFAVQVGPRIRGVSWGATGGGGDLVQLKK